MADFESVTVRGKVLEASRMWVGTQEFLIVAIPSNRDAATAEIHTQQAIEIVPGLRIQDKKSGKKLKILSKPQG